MQDNLQLSFIIYKLDFKICMTTDWISEYRYLISLEKSQDCYMAAGLEKTYFS